MEAVKKDEDYFLRRAQFIDKFFIELGYEISLLGDVNAPLFVTENNIVLSCYVHNFNLIFMDNHHNAKEVFRVKLNKSLRVEPVKEIFEKWLRSAEHRSIYFFRYNDLYYHRTIVKNNESYPLWVVEKEMGYFVFSKKKAEQVQLELTKFDAVINIS